MKLKKGFLHAVLLTALSSPTYADDGTIQQGAQQYDWQTCVSNKTNDCMTGSCVNSEDIDCQSNCDQIAKDKCKAEGISPPTEATLTN